MQNGEEAYLLFPVKNSKRCTWNGVPNRYEQNYAHGSVADSDKEEYCNYSVTANNTSQKEEDQLGYKTFQIVNTGDNVVQKKWNWYLITDGFKNTKLGKVLRFVVIARVSITII